MPWKCSFMKHHRRDGDLEWCVLSTLEKERSPLFFTKSTGASLMKSLWVPSFDFSELDLQPFIFLIKLLK